MKTRLDELAIFGGEPAFHCRVHVGAPNIGNRERLLERINDLLDRRWLTNNGYYVQQLEEKLADYLGAKHCIVACNGTVGLEIAIRALDIRGEAIIPAFTFVATAHALQWQEITPVFCDVTPDTFVLDPDKVEESITPRTTAIIGVHLWGRPCEAERLQEIATNHGLRLMFDAAHAFSCSYKGKMIGTLGDAEVFSFHATKFLNTFEGGAIVTNSDELAQKIRRMKNFGFIDFDEVVHVGTNGKMSEVCAAMGLTGLESINEFVEHNYNNYKCYQQQLSGLPGIELFTYDERERCNYQYIVAKVKENAAQIERDLLVKILQAENVMARRYFYPGCHKMEPYRSYFPHAKLLLPETEKISRQVIVLPTGTATGTEEIVKICDIIRFVVSNGREIKQRLYGPAGVADYSLAMSGFFSI